MSNNLARGQEKLSTPLAGYTREESCDDLQYQTGQNVNGQKRAADTVVYGTYALSTGNAIAAGSTQRVIKKIAHGAKKNDIIQFTSGLASGLAIQIVSCPDANTMILVATPEFSLAVGDTFDIKRYVSPQYDSTGALSVTVPPGISTEAKQDDLITAIGLLAKLTDTQPTLNRDVSASGTITTQNLNTTGVATANSAVEITTEGKAMTCFQVTGTFTGSLAIAHTVNGTDWKVETGSLIRNSADGGVAATVTTAGIYQVSCAGFLKIRVFMLTAMTGSASISMIASASGEIVSDALVATLLTTLTSKFPASLGQKAMSASLAVTLASDQSSIPVQESKQMSEFKFFDYTGVSSAGYTEIIASTLAATKSLTWFESSGQPMVIALGGIGAEVDLFIVPPGGFNGEIPIPIPAGSRVSIKQLNATALTSGIFLMTNLFK